MQSDIVASCVTVAARLSASVTHWHTVTLPSCRNRGNNTDGRWVQPSGLQGCYLRCFQGLVTLLAIPPHSSSWVSFFLRSLRPAYFTYFLLSSLVHDQGRKERQGWAVDQQSAYCPVVDSGFLHASFCSFYDWTVRLHVSTATTHQYKCFRSIISEKSCRCCRNQIMLLLSPLTVDLVSSFSDFPSFFWQINS